MKDNQNLFYSSISNYYSDIFPYNPAQLQFIKKHAGDLNEKQVIDIGCATGELAFHLSQEGATVTGIDLNQDLLDQAKAQKLHHNLHFQTGNMLELENDFPTESIDIAVCFGNTLVHLPNVELVKLMLQGVYSILKPGGQFMMQILNYDYILQEKISELPSIETDNIKFIRKYRFLSTPSQVGFYTELHLKKEEKVISNETILLALKSDQLRSQLQKSGFKNVEFFANFKSDSFGGNHLPLVVHASK